MKIHWTLVILFWLFVLTGCEDRRKTIILSSTSLPGVYKGTYKNGQTETFTIKSNGVFSQCLSKDGVVLHTNEGRWKIDKGDVVFNDVYLAIDVWKYNNGLPFKTTIFRASWDSHVPSIVFSDDQHYWLDKQSEVPIGEHESNTAN